jgi:hypothetical protein
MISGRSSDRGARKVCSTNLDGIINQRQLFPGSHGFARGSDPWSVIASITTMSDMARVFQDKDHC